LDYEIRRQGIGRRLFWGRLNPLVDARSWHIHARVTCKLPGVRLQWSVEQNTEQMAATDSSIRQTETELPPKSAIAQWLRAWWPAVAWAVVISTMSTDTFSSAHTQVVIEPILSWLFPWMSPDALDLAHHVIRKCAHFTEYFIFSLLLYHGIRASRKNGRPWHWSWALVAWVIAAAYSALDEIHQIFVPSRGASAWDSLLDSTGALIALVVLFLLYRRFQRSAGSPE
jgi:VanZ family protein